MNELERWVDRSRIVPSREERAHGRALDRIKRETQLTGFRVDAEAALTARAMERTVDIDNYRKSLAGDDPVLNEILGRIEIGFVTKVEQIQRRFGSEFGS